MTPFSFSLGSRLPQSNHVLPRGKPDCEKLINSRVCQLVTPTQSPILQRSGCCWSPPLDKNTNTAESNAGSRVRLYYLHWFLMGSRLEHPQGIRSDWRLRLREGKGDAGVAMSLVTGSCQKAIWCFFINQKFAEQQLHCTHTVLNVKKSLVVSTYIVFKS